METELLTYFCLEEPCSHCGQVIRRGDRLYRNGSSDAFCSVSCLKNDVLRRMTVIYRERKGTQSKFQEVYHGTH